MSLLRTFVVLVKSENADYQKQLRKQLHLEDDIAMHSAIIHLAENATNGISWQSTKGTSPRVSHVFYFIVSARIRVYLKVLHFESGLKRMEALPDSARGRRVKGGFYQ